MRVVIIIDIKIIKLKPTSVSNIIFSDFFDILKYLVTKFSARLKFANPNNPSAKVNKAKKLIIFNMGTLRFKILIIGMLNS